MSIGSSTAIVTGATRGIGRAVASALARDCAAVIVAGSTSARARAAESSLREALSGNPEPVQIASAGADLSKPDGGTALGNACLEIATEHRWPPPSVFVHCAGVAHDNVLARLQRTTVDEMMAVNVRSAIDIVSILARSMMRVRYGRIVFVGSIVADDGNAGQVGYAASKAALLGAARSISRELGPFGITANCIVPGLIDTDMLAGMPANKIQDAISRTDVRRVGTPEDVAHAVQFLVSDGAAYVTGTSLRVCGGLRL